MPKRIALIIVWMLPVLAWGAETFDAAPFGIALPEGYGVKWEDPREIHAVEAEFAEALPAGAKVRVEYWGSHWPEQHLPKDREPGGGNNGWLELGNWHVGGWRASDAEVSVSNNVARFEFRPINAHEYPALKDYALAGRYTLKIRVVADKPLPKMTRLHAWTDSTTEENTARMVWAGQQAANFHAEAFNGDVLSAATKNLATTLRVQTTVNSDPNTFDRTLVTLRNSTNVFTFRVDDLKDGALFLPEYGAAILPENDGRDYATVASDVRRAGKKTLYDRIAEMPEQTWQSAWNGMPPKKSVISFILGLDGGRQKFRLDGNGDLFIRWNDQYMKGLPGRDTPRMETEKAPVQMLFGLPNKPTERHTDEESIPLCLTTWDRNGLRITQTAFATTLAGMQTNAPPASDACAVAMARFDFSNTTAQAVIAELPITARSGNQDVFHSIDTRGFIWNGTQLRGQVVSDAPLNVVSNHVSWSAKLAPHETRFVVVKMPFLPLLEGDELRELAKLDFDRERKCTDDYWRPILDKSARLITPEPVLNKFFRTTPAHLLINSEFDPGGTTRFARVGSMNYGVYGNESCMMVLDLDRRGYHKEAEECLDAWLKNQGTVALPGDFDSKEGVLYGAQSYEAGGYNQHHGWILWTLAEHYRFTRDEAWLRRVATNIVAAADWIIRETSKPTSQEDLAQGLLPPGDLEDIGDWWTWLSTSCYTWRGLDSAAWALEQIHDPAAGRIRETADAYHKNLIDHFLAASERSPVVRLRDGTAVPQIPSYVERRGRSFGWICETLEGAMHLMITKAIDQTSERAQWILKDYEDNLYLSNQYGYTLDDFDKYWFGRGGMSMQACLLFDVEAYLYRDDVKQALRAMFNAIALNHFPDVHMNTEHSLPDMGNDLGDKYKTSDEANACGWLRYLFVREDDEELFVGQAIPREWLKAGQKCGIENTATYFGNMSVTYEGGTGNITGKLQGPTRNPPRTIRMRFRTPGEQRLKSVSVNDKPWTEVEGDWVKLPGNIGSATVVATY